MYKDKILDLLRSSHGAFLSGEELGRKTGISRTMVWKHIKSLEREGFGIEAVPSRGYRIVSEPDVLRRSDISRGLRTRTIGRDVRLLPSVESTNTLAMELAAQGAPEGTIVIAEMQTGGKGRRGRQWISPRGNLYLSVVLRPDVPLHKAPLITLMGAVAVATAVGTRCAIAAGIKWPNDVLVNGKKVCGLLTEMSAEQDRIRHIVLGIGVDVNMDIVELPEELRSTTTTLRTETGRRVDRAALTQEILRELEDWYDVFLDHPSYVLEEWERLNITTGNRVTVGGTGETIAGIAERIDQEGRLVIRQDDGTLRTVAAGDVTLLKKS